METAEKQEVGTDLQVHPTTEEVKSELAQGVGTAPELEPPKEIAEAIKAEEKAEAIKTEGKAEAKAPKKATAKAPKKTAEKKAAGKGDKAAVGKKLESLKDFVKGVRGASPKKAGAKAGQSRTMGKDAKKSMALKALLRAMANRGWKSGKSGVYTLSGHKVATETDGHFVVVDSKYQLALGKGAIIELDSYMG